jgi:hypothetical protein
LARIASIVIVLTLLGGTAIAFAVTERLKLERSPIAAPEIDRVFSPTCDCARERANIGFRLRKHDTISLAIVDGEGGLVRELLDSARLAAGPVRTSWNGRDANGNVVAEASYWPRLYLRSDRRTIVLPNPIRVDTTPPRIRLLSVRPTDGFSPDGDGRNDKLTVRYAVSEKARGLLLIDGERRVLTRRRPLTGRMEWFGLVGGRSLPAGSYRVAAGAEDLAGNLAAPTRAVPVEIRYITLGRTRLSAPARTRFGLRVRTDARTFRWRFAGRTGTARPGLLVLRAPRQAGRYTVFVSANGHGVRARVRVTPRTLRRPG